MFAGGKIGVAFDVVSMIQIAVIGNLLLAAYAASLALIAARSGLNAVLMGRFCWEAGSKRPISCWLRRTRLVRMGNRDGGDRIGQAAGWPP